MVRKTSVPVNTYSNHNRLPLPVLAEFISICLFSYSMCMCVFDCYYHYHHHRSIVDLS